MSGWLCHQERNSARIGVTVVADHSTPSFLILNAL